MDIRPIRTDDDLRATFAEMERLWNAAAGSEEEARLDVLATLVEAYEAKTFRLPEASPADVLAAYMEDRGLEQKDLARLIGSRSRASEIMSGKRGLSIQHLRLLSKEWRVPADALLGEVAPPRRTTAMGAAAA